MTKLKTNTVGDYLFLHFSFLIYSFVGVISKTVAMQEPFSPSFWGFALLVFGILVVYALLWQQTLKKFPLVKAYSNKGIVVIWNLLWAFFIFNEVITIENIIGSAIIICGVILVSSDD